MTGIETVGFTEFFEAMRTISPGLLSKIRTCSTVYNFYDMGREPPDYELNEEILVATDSNLSRLNALFNSCMDYTEDGIAFYGRKEAYVVLKQVFEIAYAYFAKTYDPYIFPMHYDKYKKAMEEFKKELDG